MIKKIIGNDWFRASGTLIGWFMLFRFMSDTALQYLQANSWILYATVCTILSWLLLFRHRLFLSRSTKNLILRGVQYNAEKMLSAADEHLKTKLKMLCPSCGGQRVSLKGLNRFGIDVTAKNPKGGSGLISAVLSCDDCGLIQQHNLPLSLFDSDEDKDQSLTSR